MLVTPPNVARTGFVTHFDDPCRIVLTGWAMLKNAGSTRSRRGRTSRYNYANGSRCSYNVARRSGQRRVRKAAVWARASR